MHINIVHIPNRPSKVQEKQQYGQVKLAELDMVLQEKYDEGDEEYREMMRDVTGMGQQPKQQQQGLVYHLLTQQKFEATKKMNALHVVNIRWSQSPVGTIMDEHLKEIAQSHPEVHFCYMNAGEAQQIIEKFIITELPTVCLFRKGVLVHKIVGLKELNDSEEFTTIDLEKILAKHQMFQTPK